MKNHVLKYVLLACLLAGCVSKHRVDAYHGNESSIGSEAGFYVMQPKDGQYGHKSYVGSGEQTATAVVESLAKHTDRVVQAEVVGSLEQAYKAARAQKLAYVFQPTILHWEDRNTEWSGITDKITVKYVVYSVRTKKIVASTVARASTKWFTFGGDHPQDLLPESTDQFVSTLF